MAERAFDAIDDLGGLPDTGEFPMDFTDTHDLSIDYMLREAIGYGQQDVAALESAAATKNMTPQAEPLVNKALQMAKRHLATLEGLTPPRAGGVAILTAKNCHETLRHARAFGSARVRRRSDGGDRPGSRGGRREHRCDRHLRRDKRGVRAAGGEFEGVSAAVGMQPNYLPRPEPGDWDRVVAIAVSRASSRSAKRASTVTGISRRSTCSRIISIGICGSSQERGLPFIVHMRDCDEDIWSMLREAHCAGRSGVMHSFTGSRQWRTNAWRWAFTSASRAW